MRLQRDWLHRRKRAAGGLVQYSNVEIFPAIIMPYHLFTQEISNTCKKLVINCAVISRQETAGQESAAATRAEWNFQPVAVKNTPIIYF
jgi:hypothetical protein